MGDETDGPIVENRELSTERVELTIDVREHMYTGEVNNNESPCVELHCRYPSGVHFVQFPMFVEQLFNMDHIGSARLERVSRFDGDRSKQPFFAGYYINSHEWAVLSQHATSDMPNVDTYDGFIKRGEESVIWDATWDETTDTLLDISLPGVDMDDTDRLTRPWDDE